MAAAVSSRDPKNLPQLKLSESGEMWNFRYRSQRARIAICSDDRRRREIASHDEAWASMKAKVPDLARDLILRVTGHNSRTLEVTTKRRNRVEV